MNIRALDHLSSDLVSVKLLGRKNAATLGFLPEGAFDEHARKRQILVALADTGECLGYLLYRISNRTAKIVHLCVGLEERSSGIGRQLIEALKAETKDLLGISLRCRKDYVANRIWPRFGFVNYGEKPGRGKGGAVLVTWRLDNGHPTLFDISDSTEESDKLDIVVDANVFFDFFDESRPGHDESSVLMADWLDELVQVWVVDEILNDIGRAKDEAIQRKSRALALTYLKQGYKPEEVDSLIDTLRRHFLNSKSELSDRDESDVRHLAKTICTKSLFFITRDEPLTKAMSDFVYHTFGIRILRPADFVRQIDEIRRERDYQPANLCGTEIKRVFVKAGEDSDLVDLFHQNESRSNFQNRLRGFISNVDNFESHVIRDETDGPIGLMVFDCTDDLRLRIPILRAKRGALARTILRNMISLSINHSIMTGRNSVEMTDVSIGNEIENALLEEGFLRSKATWVKFQVNRVATISEFAHLMSTYTGITEDEKIFLRQTQDVLTRSLHDIPREFYGEIERLFFPLKLSDAPISNYMISIRPGWAQELFDSSLAGRGLFPAKEDIALRREQVYYRSRLNSAGIRGPARILWYITDTRYHLPETRSVRAVSQVYEVVVDKPKILYKKFMRLGIYEWEDVFEIAKREVDNEVMAIRFGNTQLFSRSVSLDDANLIFAKYSQGLQLQSPMEISSAAFVDIYKKGTPLD